MAYIATVGITSATDSTVTGFAVQSVKTSKSGESVTWKLLNGFLAEIIVLGGKIELSMEGVVKSTYAEPEIGDTLTINTVAFKVTKVDLSETVGDVQKASITAEAVVVASA
jgi:hypothetical protein